MDHLHRGAMRRVAQLHMFWTDEEVHLSAIAGQAQRWRVRDFAQFGGDTGRMHFTPEKMPQSNELGHKARAGALHDFVWRGVLDELALIDNRQVRSKTQRFFLIVGDQDGSDASLLENGLDFVAQLLPEMDVEVTKRLIEEEQLGRRSQSTSERHT